MRKQRRQFMMRREPSIGQNLQWLGEQAQSQFLDLNSEKHAADNATETSSDTTDNDDYHHQQHDSASSLRSFYPSKLRSYNSFRNDDHRYTIRHQVIVWSVGIPDVKLCRVSLMFRVTLFWYDHPPSPPVLLPLISSSQNIEEVENNDDDDGDADDSIWVMDGRTKAKLKSRRKRKRSQSRLRNSKNWSLHHQNKYYNSDSDDDDEEEEAIDVPPISIINAVDFEIVGRPDVTCLSSSGTKKGKSKNTRLMRFSCMYRASLLQEASNMNVSQFPHDHHTLVLKLGILNERQKYKRWDRRIWKLALATESDTKNTIKIPHGVLVDHVNVPGYTIHHRGLEFELSPIEYGGSNTTTAVTSTMANSNSSSNNKTATHTNTDQEFCVKVSLKLKRNSAYYDRNIMPLLDTLNLVSISILISLDAESFFQRGLLCLNIAFLEIGLRNSLDARLPHVGYEIKMQKILSWYFYSILYIVLESAVMKVFIDNFPESWPVEVTRKVDYFQAFLLLLNQLYLRFVIYNDFSGTTTGESFD